MPVLTGLRRAALAGVVTTGLVACGVHATQPVAPAQPAPWEVATADPPSPERAIAAYGRVEEWVRAWKLPDEAGAATLGLDPVPAAAVTLRLGGVVIGRGQDAGGDALTIWRAAREAIGEAGAKMPVEFDALRDVELLETAERVTIGIELAGALVPLDADTRQDVSLRVMPGVEGIAVEVNERRAMIFPMTMLGAGLEPARAFSSALSEATQDARAGLLSPADARQRHAARAFRFSTIHVGQTRAGEPPVFLDRGGRMVELSSLDARAIAGFADSVADHMISRAWPEETGLGFGGTMHATRREGVFEPEAAAPEQQALAVLALWRYSRAPGIPPGRAERARAAALEALASLARVEASERAPASDPGSAAACVGVIAELIADGATLPTSVADLHHACGIVLDHSVTDDGVFDARVEPGARGVACWALTRRALLLPEGAARDAGLALARRAAREIFRSTDPGALVTHMPFLGWSEQLLAGETMPSAVALREMRAEVWRHQLAGSELPVAARDLVGGIVFSASRMPLPTWETARGVCFPASMLADARLTDRAEAPAEIVRVLGSVRFLRQLMLDDTMRSMLPLADRAIGGVRAAPWDLSLPLDASAMTLLTLVEFMEGLEGLRPADAP